jgi:hypothetical protein
MLRASLHDGATANSSSAMPSIEIEGGVRSTKLLLVKPPCVDMSPAAGFRPHFTLDSLLDVWSN